MARAAPRPLSVPGETYLSDAPPAAQQAPDEPPVLVEQQEQVVPQVQDVLQVAALAPAPL